MLAQPGPTGVRRGCCFSVPTVSCSSDTVIASRPVLACRSRSGHRRIVKAVVAVELALLLDVAVVVGVDPGSAASLAVPGDGLDLGLDAEPGRP